MTNILVIGYGNTLRADDGLGWIAAQQLASESLPSNVTVLACRQLTPELSESIRFADLVIFIDARLGESGHYFGTRAESTAHPGDVGMHYFDPAVLLDCAQQLYGSHPAALAIGINGDSFAFQDHLSDRITARLPALLACARTLIQDAAHIIRKEDPMHEYAIVELMVHQTLAGLNHAGIEPNEVVGVRFQRGSTFSEDALRQSFEALTKGTLLEGADVLVETINIAFKCTCGYQQTITSDDLIGHMFVCPECCAVREVDEAHDLTLIEVILRPTERFNSSSTAQAQP